MCTKGAYQYSLAEKLSFTRFGGTDEELRAARILMDEIGAAGGTGELLEFEIPAFDVKTCRLRFMEPFEREVEAAPYWRSGCLPEGGTDGKPVYIERGEEEDYAGLPEDLSGTVLLVNELSRDVYRRICEHRPAAFITIDGKAHETGETRDLVPVILRDPYLEFGRVPGFVIRAKDAMELVSREVGRIRLELTGEEHTNPSRDVTAVIEGSEFPEESVVLTAHYDSFCVGTGSWDNATGAVNLMYLYRYFTEHTPRRTMRFVWCGSEEQGMLGSRAWVEQNEALLDSVKLNFNFDMNGTILGQNCIHVTGGDDLTHFVRQFCREAGFPAQIDVHVHSSDSAVFADRGIPAIGISRVTKFAEIHTRNDVITTLSAKEMERIGVFSAAMISRIVNAGMIPVAREMPEKMKEALDRHFFRDRKQDGAAQTGREDQRAGK